MKMIIRKLLCLILALLATWQGAWAEETGPLSLGGETVTFEASGMEMTFTK